MSLGGGGVLLAVRLAVVWLMSPEAESKEKHVVWEPIMPELIITAPHSTPESNSGALSYRAVGPGALSSKAMNPEL
jgi:hypothetical protein